MPTPPCVFSARLLDPSGAVFSCVVIDKRHPRSDAGPQSQESLRKGDRPTTEVRAECLYQVFHGF